MIQSFCLIDHSGHISKKRLDCQVIFCWVILILSQFNNLYCGIRCAEVDGVLTILKPDISPIVVTGVHPVLDREDAVAEQLGQPNLGAERQKVGRDDVLLAVLADVETVGGSKPLRRAPDVFK